MVQAAGRCSEDALRLSMAERESSLFDRWPDSGMPDSLGSSRIVAGMQTSTSPPARRTILHSILVSSKEQQ
jgi:hypothetical protein